MFNAGDAVIHPNLGAGIIKSVQNMTMKEEKQPFYRIEIIGKTRTKVMIPAEQAEKLGLRAAIALEDIDAIWVILSAAANDLPDDNKQRKMELENKLHNSGTQGFAELVRDITWRKLQGKTVHAPGRAVFDRAMAFLTGELAIRQNQEAEQLRSRVVRTLEGNLKERLV